MGFDQALTDEVGISNNPKSFHSFDFIYFFISTSFRSAFCTIFILVFSFQAFNSNDRMIVYISSPAIWIIRRPHREWGTLNRRTWNKSGCGRPFNWILTKCTGIDFPLHFVVIEKWQIRAGERRKRRMIINLNALGSCRRRNNTIGRITCVCNVRCLLHTNLSNIVHSQRRNPKSFGHVKCNHILMWTVSSVVLGYSHATRFVCKLTRAIAVTEEGTIMGRRRRHACEVANSHVLVFKMPFDVCTDGHLISNGNLHSTNVAPRANYFSQWIFEADIWGGPLFPEIFIRTLYSFPVETWFVSGV